MKNKKISKMPSRNADVYIDKVALCMCLDFALRGDNSNESILKKEKRLTV